MAPNRAWFQTITVISLILLFVIIVLSYLLSAKKPWPLQLLAFPGRYSLAVWFEIRGEYLTAAKNYEQLSSGVIHRAFLRRLAADNLRKSAIAIFARRDYLKSAELFNRARSFCAPDMFTVLLEGISQQKLKNTTRAIELFFEAQNLAPHTADPQIALANLYFITREPSLAEVHYLAASAKDPANPLPMINWGDALSWIGDSGEALKRYQLALTIDSRSPEAHLRIARCLLKSNGSKTEALGHVAQVRQIRPDHPELPELTMLLADSGKRIPERTIAVDRHLLLQQRVLFKIQQPDE